MGDNPNRAQERSPASARVGFWLRLGAAHLLAYPAAFAAAMAGVPFAMAVWGDAVLAATTEEQAHSFVLRVSLIAGALTYILIHLYALPWALRAWSGSGPQSGPTAAAHRDWHIFLYLSLSTCALWVVGGVIGWAWLLT